MRPFSKNQPMSALARTSAASVALSLGMGLMMLSPVIEAVAPDAMTPVIGLFGISDAQAQGLDGTALPPPREEDDLPIPTLDIDRLPPMWSYEVGVQMSYGEVAYFREVMQPWIGFGLRGGAGRNFGLHRVGGSLAVILEGEVAVHTQIMVEPAVTWDFVSPKQIYLGAGIGPSFSYLDDASTVVGESGFAVAPHASARIGWSQTWSRIGRRLFVYVEPKVRMVDGNFSPVAALGFGSGQGR